MIHSDSATEEAHHDRARGGIARLSAARSRELESRPAGPVTAKFTPIVTQR